ncbi:MAG: hypothetical protein HQL84_11030 [Magnetococcales bacterium]|nr:hypothetical protein [Magnetococcales bacterium]MBF0150566.1 hypothetical protein [Magnetococcales bacterium]MBF0171817.1 hypothetical protein [Magnetococcales bacterium]MBF0346140.1 hypothetical protein [Magnetococcales bacterium]
MFVLEYKVHMGKNQSPSSIFTINTDLNRYFFPCNGKRMFFSFDRACRGWKDPNSVAKPWGQSPVMIREGGNFFHPLIVWECGAIENLVA